MSITERVTLNRLQDLDAQHFDAVIDARSPGEFAEDRLPGAINLPVLEDDERARVGTIYTRESRFEARKLGAALVARNVARHLETTLADRPRDFRPLVYCWRGGQRSGAFALILAQVGWRVSVLEGGWRSWRRLVATALYERPFPAPVWLLDGNTGTAKTALLAELSARDVQVIDLEAMARHRGSIFGAMGGQPAQKGFESALATAMARLDPNRPVVIEAESARIGALRLPPALWQAMVAAPVIRIEAPLAARARFLARAYDDLTRDGVALSERIAALSAFHPRTEVAHWQALAQNRDFEPLAAALMAAHYDPAYARIRSREGRPIAKTLITETLEPADLPHWRNR
jgi:tRNA 2-selenouridine synthase